LLLALTTLLLATALSALAALLPTLAGLVGLVLLTALAGLVGLILLSPLLTALLAAALLIVLISHCVSLRWLRELPSPGPTAHSIASFQRKHWATKRVARGR
jgi:hypothetical protein